MLRFIVTIQLLMSLLGSGWVQASAVNMAMPDADQALAAELLAAQDLPPCHRQQLMQEIAEKTELHKTDMACCDSNCDCDGLCQSFSFDLSAGQGTAPTAGSAAAIAYSSVGWATVTSRSLYRPPIR